METYFFYNWAFYVWKSYTAEELNIIKVRTDFTRDHTFEIVKGRHENWDHESLAHFLSCWSHWRYNQLRKSSCTLAKESHMSWKRCSVGFCFNERGQNMLSYKHAGVRGEQMLKWKHKLRTLSSQGIFLYWTLKKMHSYKMWNQNSSTSAITIFISTIY